ncbi:MAG: hypothetical protein ABS873_03205 [Alkalibacterium sp.]
MNNIGVVLIDKENEKESTAVSKKVLPYLKRVGRRAYDTTFEVISLTDYTVPVKDQLKISDKGHQQLSKKDGYIFIVPTFSGEVPKDYCQMFSEISDELNNKSALVICYGSDADRINTKRRINEVLLQYDIGLPTSDIFLPEYNFFDWNLKKVIEDYITSRIKEFIYWTQAMKYLRNLKKSLDIERFVAD